MSIDRSDISKMMLEASKSCTSSSKSPNKSGSSGSVDGFVPSADTGNFASPGTSRLSISPSSDDPRLDPGWMQRQMADIEALDDEDPLPDPPRRPLSAYNFFFKAERARILGVDDDDDCDLDGQDDEAAAKKRKHRKTPGMIGFRQLANHVGERWRSLSTEEKIPYQKKFEQDRIRYKTEMKAWEDAQRRRTIRQNKAMMARIKLEKEAKKQQQEQEKSFAEVEGEDEIHDLQPVISHYDDNVSNSVKTKTLNKTSAILSRAMNIIGEDRTELLPTDEDHFAGAPFPPFFSSLPSLRDGSFNAAPWDARSNHSNSDSVPMAGMFGDSSRPVVSPQAESGGDWYTALKSKKQKMMDSLEFSGSPWTYGKDLNVGDALDKIRRGVQLKQWQQHLQQQLAECDYEEQQARQGVAPHSYERRMGLNNHFDQGRETSAGLSVEEEMPEPEVLSSEEAMLHYRFNMWQNDADKHRKQATITRNMPIFPTPPGPKMLPAFSDEMSPTFNHLEAELGNIMGDEFIQCMASM